MDNRTLHPRRGPHNPLRTPSTRLPGSVRRTATLDTLRPEGLTGPLHLRGAARDLVTDGDGNGTVSGRAALTAEVDFMGGRTVTALRSDPDESRLRGLVGTQTWRGFRSILADVVPDHVRSASLLHLMLDDVPVAALVSGHAMISAGVRPGPAGHRYRPTPDLCSGWRTFRPCSPNCRSIRFEGVTRFEGMTPTPRGRPTIWYVTGAVGRRPRPGRPSRGREACTPGPVRAQIILAAGHPAARRRPAGAGLHPRRRPPPRPGRADRPGRVPRGGPRTSGPGRAPRDRTRPG